MRTSSHHQPEAQHPKSPAIYTPAGRLPHLCADFVAKVGGPLQVRNFRIQRARRLNQCCAAGLFFESMLRVRIQIFFLQQYRHLDGVIGRPVFRSLEILGAALQADGGTRSAFAASSIRRRSAAWTILPD